MIGSQTKAKIFSSYLNSIQKNDESGKESADTSVENTEPVPMEITTYEHSN